MKVLVTVTILAVTAVLASEETASTKQKRGVLGLGYGYDYGLNAASSLPLSYAAPLAYSAPIASYHAPLSLPSLPIAKVAYAAPIAKLAYTAPIAKVAYTAPVAYAKYAAPLPYW
ncbi:pupal cuticle protein C1B-like [Cryptotermes secundus]|uniref:pupal cuticle protein C1B-like n=1 Tax=Cryptotermes secundus TaxID=105785 RepID=UPI000CD7B65A|nr:pupal cuticle protein C1B-like [Cryptotermes secundus]